MSPRPTKTEMVEPAVSELFHENSKHHSADPRTIERIMAVMANPILQGILANSAKRYPSAPKVKLPDDLPMATRSFDTAVLERRSDREFDGGPLSLPEVAKIVFCAGGVTARIDLPGFPQQQPLKAAPSGGALYPVELYLFALNVTELKAGLYHYASTDNCLELVSEVGAAQELARICFSEALIKSAAVIVLTGISLKSRLKYGERGYRFMLLEAGHMAQNALLTANALQLAACPYGGFIDDDLDRLLGIDGLDEVSLYLIALGRVTG
jgi:SagB-type dehydrogenase family enzyme